MADNPHPEARCPYCGAIKPCVSFEACSQLCAEILGFPKNGLPSPKDKEREHLRTLGIKDDK